MLILLKLALMLVLLIAFTASTIVKAQPTVQTLPADGPTTDIYGTFYGINGKINMNGQDTEYTFMLFDSSGGLIGYYPEPYATLTSSSVACSSGTCDVGVALWIYRNQPGLQTDLQPSTTYSFQLIARWTGGDWQYGAMLSFTTLASQYPIMTNILTVLASSTTSQSLGPGFDFALSVSPSTVSVSQGGTAHYAVYVMYSNPSYAGTLINIQLTGVGPGMNYDLSQSGDLTITTSQTTPPGSYSIVLTGSANGVTHQTGATLIVTSEQPTTTVVTATSTTSSSQTTTSSGSPATSSVLTVNQPAQTSTNTEITTPVGSNLTNIIQQNPSIILVAIILILLAALACSDENQPDRHQLIGHPQT